MLDRDAPLESWQLHRLINSEACQWPTTCNTCELIADALSAAEARGRQQAEQELASIDAILARRPALDLPTRWQNIEKAISVAARCDKSEATAADAKAQNERLVERVQQAEQALDFFAAAVNILLD